MRYKYSTIALLRSHHQGSIFEDYCLEAYDIALRYHITIDFTLCQPRKERQHFLPNHFPLPLLLSFPLL
jgi:hypothetical protein